MGFTLSSHFCGGKRVKTELTLFNNDVSCGMEETTNSCESKEQMKANCCQNEFQKIQLEDEYNLQQIQIKLSSDFVFAFVVTYLDLALYSLSEYYVFQDHSPPPIIRDIPVLVQSFLI